MPEAVVDPAQANIGKTVGEALSAIKQWFEQKVYQAVRMHQVDKGTPWKVKMAYLLPYMTLPKPKQG